MGLLFTKVDMQKLLLTTYTFFYFFASSSSVNICSVYNKNAVFLVCNAETASLETLYETPVLYTVGQ